MVEENQSNDIGYIADERLKRLGFKPQKENIYNKLLPYADELDDESTKLFQEIKTNLVKSVLAHEIRPGFSLWTRKLNQYIKIYNLKFSKTDHIALVKLYYSFVTAPNITSSRFLHFSSTLHLLLKKRLLTQDDLQLDWKPLYDVSIPILQREKSEFKLYRYFHSHFTGVISLIRLCRMYFPVECTQDVLDEIQPRFSMINGVGVLLLELFVPVVQPDGKANLGYNLWLDEMMTLWKFNHNVTNWDGSLTTLFGRLALYNIGRIKWDPYVPLMFARLGRALQLPVSYKKIQMLRLNNYDKNHMCVWIVSCLGGKDNVVFYHLEKFMHRLSTYFHPTNSGRWSSKLREFLKRLSYVFVERINGERHKEETWHWSVPDEFKLTDEDIEKFINILKPSLEHVMFSKQGQKDVASTMQYLASLRPDIIVPMVLEKLNASIDSLTDSHKLTCSMACLTSIARFMANGAERNYPQGPVQVYPILKSLLPGIDPNDIKKCLITFHLIAHLCNLAPLVDSSEAVKYYNDLTEEEHTICEDSADLEDFFLLLLDKLLMWVESSSLEFTRSDTSTKSDLEIFSESNMLSFIFTILTQCSSSIYMAALKKIHNFITTHILESKIGGILVSKICSAFVQTNPEKAFSVIFLELCDTIDTLLDDETLNDEEINDELSYNLNIFGAFMEGGAICVDYIDRITNILSRLLQMKSINGRKLATGMLRFLVTSLSEIVPLEYRSCNKSFNTPIQEFLTIREWGKAMNFDDLNISWYTPKEKEIDCLRKLFDIYLFPVMDELNEYSKGEKTFSRTDLNSKLAVICALLDSRNVLPQWEESPLQLVNSVLETRPFKVMVGKTYEFKMPDGSNIRKSIADLIHNVQKKILETDEGDIKSLYLVIHIHNSLLFENFDHQNYEQHWIRSQMIKNAVQDRSNNKKRHLRYTLIDRAMLHQGLRHENSISLFTETHKQIYLDLFELSTIHYGTVRIIAQKELFNALVKYPYSYRVLMSSIREVLQLDPLNNHEKFKGCLYLLCGAKNVTMLTRQDWEFIKEVWPLLILSKPSEKESIINLLVRLTKEVNEFPTVAIDYEVPEQCISAAYELGRNIPLDDFKNVIACGSQTLKNVCQSNVANYKETIDSLLNACVNKNLHWRHFSMAIQFIKNLVHVQVNYNAQVIKFFFKALINESLDVRKMALKTCLYILIQNKQKFEKCIIDPSSLSNCKSSKHGFGVKPENLWMLYNSKTKPTDTTEWDKVRYVHKRFVGHYAWPKTLKVHAPSYEQPNFSKRSAAKLNDEEQAIVDFFTEENVQELVRYFSMEEKKNNDHFDLIRFLFFKLLARNYEDHFLHLFIPHIEKLAIDHHEQSQRCAIEIICGMISGSKCWSFDQIEKFWSVMIPILASSFQHISDETSGDWTLGLSLAVASRDPNRLHWLYEFLIDNLLNEPTSFIISCRLSIVHSVLLQQSWRNSELIDRGLEQLHNSLSHPFQNVRYRISYYLGLAFSEDRNIHKNDVAGVPKVKEFFAHIMPELDKFYDSLVTETSNMGEGDRENCISNKLINMTLSDSEKREETLKLFKTVAKYVSISTARLVYSVVIQFYQLLPLTCVLQSYENDDEVKQICTGLIGTLAHSVILEEYVPSALQSIKKATECSNWSARAVIAEFIPVFVFHNFNVLITNSEWISELTSMVLLLLEDTQPEVRLAAGEILSGFLHSNIISNPDELLLQFEVKSRTKLNVRNNQQKIRVRHAGVIGMCAFVNAHPYDLPEFLKDIFTKLGNNLNDPAPIPETIHKTLGKFKSTHYEDWKSHFTEEELCLHSDLIVPPSHYA